MILIIDNYDSFVYNLARYVRQLTDAPIAVYRNDQIDIAQLNPNDYSAVIISPGPCGPKDAGQSISIIQRFHSFFPILGVCLGHQAIVEAFGGRIVESENPFHGKSSEVFHQCDSRLFDSVPSPFVAGRYHSLHADLDRIPESLKVTAKTSNGEVMAIEHREYDCFGVQFHPESVLTENGYDIIRNFLTIAGIKTKTPNARIFS